MSNTNEAPYGVYKFQMGDGNDGYTHSQLVAINDRIRDLPDAVVKGPHSAMDCVCQALVISAHIVGHRARKFLTQTDPSIDEFSEHLHESLGRVASYELFWLEGPSRIVAINGAAWKTARLYKVASQSQVELLRRDYDGKKLAGVPDGAQYAPNISSHYVIDLGARRWLANRGVHL